VYAEGNEQSGHRIHNFPGHCRELSPGNGAQPRCE
jgi:hypothetical protein